MIAQRGQRGQRGQRARVRRLLDSGLVDQEWVEAQTGTSYAGPAEAAAAYLASRPRISPHPLVEPDWIASEHEVPDGEDPLLWWLADDERVRTLSPHPLVDVGRIRRPLPAWLADARPGTKVPTPRRVPAVTWGELRRLALAAVREHAALESVERVPDLLATLPDAPPTTAPARATGGEPLVSILMPCRDQAATLHAAVASVQAQGLGAWELLVLDDGSTDDTAQVLAGLAAYDERIVVVRLPRGGAARARNEGLARARGRYVAFLDADRAWAPGFLAPVVDALESHGWASAHAATRVRGRGGDEDRYRAFAPTLAQLMVRPQVDLDALVVRTDVLRGLGGFDESLAGAGDHDLTLRLAEAHALHLVPVLGGDARRDRGPDPWSSLVLGRRLVDWEEAARTARTSGRTSVVVVVRGNAAGILDWFGSTREAGGDVELVMVGVRVRRWVDTLVRVLVSLHAGVRYERLSADVGNAVALDLGLVRSTGEHVVLANGQVVTPDLAALARLTRPLGADGVALVQPLLLNGQDLVASAGAVFGPGPAVRPVPFLEGHAPRDARAAEGTTLPAPYGPIVIARAETLIAAHGLDPLTADGLPEVDLGLRVRAQGLGRTVLATEAPLVCLRTVLPGRGRYAEAVRVLEERYGAPPPGSRAAWGSAGFDVVGVRHELLSDKQRQLSAKDVPLAVPHHVVVPRRGPLAVDEGLPSLRWVVDLASPAGRKGESWGDTHFARALAAALERLGQRVAVDPRPARHRSTRDHDDVLLVLRGLDRVVPRPGTVSLAWVISHPDLVDAAELASYDAVFAASASWSATTSARTGVPVEPLLQCTDPALFHPGRADGTPGDDVLFVGSSRGVYRSAVRTAVAVGAPLTIHGVGWEPFVAPDAIASTFVPNDDLGRLYANASVVLNDHWEDMRRDGFVSNRLFDAAAAGARVVSDDVAGLPADLGELVRVYRDEADLRRLLEDRDALFPGAEERRAIAARIGAAHSFDARAVTLAETAARLVRERSAAQ